MRENVFKEVSLGKPVELHSLNPLEEEALRDLKILLTEAHKTRASLMAEAEKEAEKILEQAHLDARAFVEKAHKRAEEIEAKAQMSFDAIEAQATQKGYDEGFESGVSQGYEAAALETMELLEAAKLMLEGAKQVEAHRLEKAEAQAVHLMSLVLKEASLVVWQELPQHVLVEAWKRAVEVHALKGDITLLIHPVQLQLIEALGQEALQLVQQLPNTTLKTDAHLPTDAIYLLNNEVNLNLSLSAVIQELCQALLNKPSS
jgi:flagellar biosynthesis/type III secretory pathway protein FliH